MPFLLTAFLLFLAFAPVAEAAGETPGATFAASVTGAGEYADTGTAQSVSISDDGRYLAFVSAAGNLDPDAPTGVAEVYVKDLATGELTLASRTDGAGGEPANEPPPGEQPQTGIERAVISGNGRYVVFTSRATNLAGDELPLPLEEAEEFFSTHVYRRDLVTGETVLVDRETELDGATHLLEASGQAISADGRLVVFKAEAPDLDEPGGEHESTGSGTIYVRDLEAGTTTAVSRASGEEGELANERSSHGAISPDGGRVAFDTFATNPGLGTEANEATQVYVRDLQSPFATTLVSRSNPSETAPAGAQANGESFEPVFLGAGCRVGFTSPATNLTAEPPPSGGGTEQLQVYVRQLAPCEPPIPGVPGPGQRPGGSDPGPGPAKLTIATLRPPHLRLGFSAAGKATVELDRRAGRAGHQRWRRLASVVLSASAPGTVGTALPALAPGRYRLRIQLQEPGSPVLGRVFTVPAR